MTRLAAESDAMPRFSTEQLADVATPALVLAADVVRANIRRLADYATKHSLAVRPHTKTHKSRDIARLQCEAGAIGLTVARAEEAASVTSAGDDVLLAFPPVDPARAELLCDLAGDRTVRAAIDSVAALEAVAGAAQKRGVTVGLLVDLDVGLKRTGVATAEQALALAQAIDRQRGVRLDGIMIYPGHIWQPADQQANALAKVSERLGEALDLWERHGLSAPIVSGGSTPTLYRSHLIGGVTEVRPGTYVYNDMNTVRGGFCCLAECAAAIVCTVVSDAVEGQVVVDAGSKALCADRCIPDPESGHGYVLEYPDAKITHLSEEHGQIDVRRCDARPAVGERVMVIPNHICPCVNLRDSAWWVEPGEAPTPLPISARGAIS